MPRRARVILGVAGVLALAAAGLLVWLRSLFASPEVRHVASLPEAIGARSLVALFAHPDDEIKVCGLLADATARGLPARLVTAARGDGGIAGDGIARSQLAAVRAAELRRHAAALGLLAQEQWDYGDGTLGALPDGVLAARLAAELRAWKPDAVLTFEPHSGYTGHPDHLAIGAAATRAFCTVARAPGGPRFLLYALAPPKVARRFGGARGRLVAAQQPPADWAIHVDPALKVRAWQIHRSQRDYVRRFAHLPPELLYRLFDEELYAVRDAAEVCGAR